MSLRWRIDDKCTWLLIAMSDGQNNAALGALSAALRPHVPNR